MGKRVKIKSERTPYGFPAKGTFKLLGLRVSVTVIGFLILGVSFTILAPFELNKHYNFLNESTSETAYVLTTQEVEGRGNTVNTYLDEFSYQGKVYDADDLLYGSYADENFYPNQPIEVLIQEDGTMILEGRAQTGVFLGWFFAIAGPVFLVLVGWTIRTMSDLHYDLD